MERITSDITLVEHLLSPRIGCTAIKHLVSIRDCGVPVVFRLTFEVDTNMPKDRELAEVVGSPLEIKPSIYRHLEEGLNSNPNGAAVRYKLNHSCFGKARLTFCTVSPSQLPERD